MKVKFKKLNPNASFPEKASDLAGGMDVRATEIIQKSEDFVICKLGFALQPPTNYKVTLVPRSSLTGTNWIIQNSPCLGDPDYIGEYQLRFRAIPNGIIKTEDGFKLSYPEFPYKELERVGQLYFEEIIQAEFELVDYLCDTERGDGGFGHTGKK